MEGRLIHDAANSLSFNGLAKKIYCRKPEPPMPTQQKIMKTVDESGEKWYICKVLW